MLSFWMYWTCSGTSNPDPSGVAIIQRRGRAGQRADTTTAGWSVGLERWTLEAAMSAIEQYLAYNFDGDADFQRGLATLLRNALPNHNVDYLTGRARAFYFSKCKGVSLW